MKPELVDFNLCPDYVGREETIHEILKKFFFDIRAKDKHFFCLHGTLMIGKSVLLREIASCLWLAQGKGFSGITFFDLD